MSIKVTERHGVNMWTIVFAFFLIGNSILGCETALDQALERERLANLVSPVPNTIRFVGKRVNSDGAGELWLSISDDRVGPLPPVIARAVRSVPGTGAVQEIKIRKEVVISIAEQLEVGPDEVGSPVGANAWIREMPSDEFFVRIRDLQMDRGWLSVTERLPGDLKPVDAVVR